MPLNNPEAENLLPKIKNVLFGWRKKWSALDETKKTIATASIITAVLMLAVFLLQAEKTKNSRAVSSSNQSKADTLRKSDIPVVGLSYTIKQGDDLESISARFKVDKEKIIAFNGLSADGKIEEGQEILIPGGQIETSSKCDSLSGIPGLVCSLDEKAENYRKLIAIKKTQRGTLAKAEEAKYAELLKKVELQKAELLKVSASAQASTTKTPQNNVNSNDLDELKDSIKELQDSTEKNRADAEKLAKEQQEKQAQANLTYDKAAYDSAMNQLASYCKNQINFLESKEQAAINAEISRQSAGGTGDGCNEPGFQCYIAISIIKNSYAGQYDYVESICQSKYDSLEAMKYW